MHTFSYFRMSDKGNKRAMASVVENMWLEWPTEIVDSRELK